MDKLNNDELTFDFTKTKLDDFGFTFQDDNGNILADQEELRSRLEKLEARNKVYDTVARELLKRITAFTNNLKQSPEKPSIHWPNRVDQIDKWLAELHEIYAQTKE